MKLGFSGRLTQATIRSPLTPLFLLTAIALGLLALFTIPREEEPQINVPILGVVENMAWFTPAELPENKYYIFGQGGGKKLALESHSVLLGQIPLVQSVSEGGDDGKPAVLQTGSDVSEAFMNVAKNTLRQVGVRNEMIAPTQIVRLGE